MKKIILLSLVTLTITFSSILFTQESTAQFKPKNVECIAPAGAGGGWDFTCRIPAAKVMSELKLIPGTMKVTNMSGGGGGVAFAHVVGKQDKNNNLIVAASMATAVRLAQNVYSGYSSKDVRWLGAVGADFAVIAVPKDSEYKDLKHLMNDIKSGKKVKVAGASSAGGWDHLKFLMVAEKAGITSYNNIGYISFTEGSTALLEVVSGRVAVFSGDTSEVIEQFKAGSIRILAVVAPNRVGALGNTKTAKEQGYDVVAANWRGFYSPKGSDDAAYDYWVDVIKKVANSDTWSKQRATNGLEPFSSFGADFEKFVNDQIALAQKLSKSLGLLK